MSSSVAPLATRLTKFPISRDPPEGGTLGEAPGNATVPSVSNF